jgi:hypothetical protein
MLAHHDLRLDPLHGAGADAEAVGDLSLGRSAPARDLGVALSDDLSERFSAIYHASPSKGRRCHEAGAPAAYVGCGSFIARTMAIHAPNYRLSHYVGNCRNVAEASRGRISRCAFSSTPRLGTPSISSPRTVGLPGARGQSVRRSPPKARPNDGPENGAPRQRGGHG